MDMANASANRKPTNVTLDASLLDEARTFKVNISAACEKGLAAELRELREHRWLEENTAAIEATNRWVEANGLPLEKSRLF